MFRTSGTRQRPSHFDCTLITTLRIDQAYRASRVPRERAIAIVARYSSTCAGLISDHSAAPRARGNATRVTIQSTTVITSAAMKSLPPRRDRATTVKQYPHKASNSVCIARPMIACTLVGSTSATREARTEAPRSMNGVHTVPLRRPAPTSTPALAAAASSPGKTRRASERRGTRELCALTLARSKSVLAPVTSL